MRISGIALSGLQASVARLNASAVNMANANTDGPVPDVRPVSAAFSLSSERGLQVYQPVRAEQTANPNGGVNVTYMPANPSYVLSYDPHASMANKDGMVASPNVDPGQETVEMVKAKSAYQASLSLIRAEDEMAHNLLNAKY